MKVHLQTWYRKWLDAHSDTNLIYVSRNSRGEPSLHQVHFVRDTLCGMLWADVPYDKRKDTGDGHDKETCYVIGEHTSKSVPLPVYSLERPDLGLQIIARDNYHDWNVSVITEKPLSDGWNILKGFQLDFPESDKKRFESEPWRPGRSWGGCYFQGFPEEVQFGPYSKDCRRFSLCMGGEYSLHTFLFLILRDLRGVGPWER